MSQKGKPVPNSQGPAPARAVIESVKPEIDGGRFPIKRTVGDRVCVSAHIFADGHDTLGAAVRYRPSTSDEWRESPMEMAEWGLDLWKGSFRVEAVGRYVYTVRAWLDAFASWRKGFRKKLDAGQDVGTDLLVGVELVEEAAGRASGQDRTQLLHAAEEVRRRRESDPAGAVALALDDALAALASRYPDPGSACTYDKELAVVVDREKAGFSAWYEMFPRSAGPGPERHGTFRDCEERLPYVAAMGFDVLYLPPIHPIGRTHRKGKNNNPVCRADDTGSPWAIGASEGGHKAIHPELGTLEDFRRLVRRAREHGLDVALDIAFQCSPDHPWVKEHPDWFRWRPDGSVQCAENPPKKYEDIYPLNFDSEHWRELWDELKSVFEFWIEQGVRIFRVDNPHTKPFSFWEWVIGEIKRRHADVLFLAEAFTRPKVMYRLAKLGFSQSYTYFAWRNTKWELTEYLTELTRTEVSEYFRPNLWPNTPDILTEYLQVGGRPAFMARLVLAATLGGNYGIYGPAFELCENRPRSPGSEEYLDSEKYQIRAWELDRPDSLKDFIGRVNRARREQPALARTAGLRFHPVDNDELLAYTKSTDDLSSVILVVVNLDPHHTQSGWVELPLQELELDAHQAYQVHDLITGDRYLWNGPRNYVELRPQEVPAHLFVLRRQVRTERDFDYYL